MKCKVIIFFNIILFRRHLVVVNRVALLPAVALSLKKFLRRLRSRRMQSKKVLAIENPELLRDVGCLKNVCPKR